MTAIPELPPGYVFKVEDHEGDPFARYILVREPDADSAALRVAKTVSEKLVHLERNATQGELAGLRPGEMRLLSPM